MSASDSPLARRRIASAFWWDINFGVRPNFTPRALACSRPSLVRLRINSPSNSANPPRTVSIKRPCAVVVSAHASSPLSSRTRTRRSEHVTVTESLVASEPHKRRSWAGSVFAPLYYVPKHLPATGGGAVLRLRVTALAIGRCPYGAVNQAPHYGGDLWKGISL